MTAQPKFWSRVGGMLDVKSSALGDDVSCALAGLETRLGNNINEEAETRKAQVQATHVRQRRQERYRPHDLGAQAHPLGRMAGEYTKEHSREGGEGAVGEARRTNTSAMLQPCAPRSCPLDSLHLLAQETLTMLASFNHAVLDELASPWRGDANYEPSTWSRSPASRFSRPLINKVRR